MNQQVSVDDIRKTISQLASNEFEGALEYFCNLEGLLFTVPDQTTAIVSCCVYTGMIWAALNENKSEHVESIIERIQELNQELVVSQPHNQAQNLPNCYEELLSDTLRYAHNLMDLDYQGIYSITNKHVETRASQDPVVHLAVRVMTRFQHDQMYQVAHRFKSIPLNLVHTMCNTGHLNDEQLVKVFRQYTQDPVRVSGNLVHFEHDYDGLQTSSNHDSTVGHLSSEIHAQKIERLVNLALHLEQTPLPV